MKKLTNMLATAIALLVVVAVLGFAVGYPVMWAWNVGAVPMLNAGEATYLSSSCLSALVLLFLGVGNIVKASVEAVKG